MILWRIIFFLSIILAFIPGDAVLDKDLCFILGAIALSKIT